MGVRAEGFEAFWREISPSEAVLDDPGRNIKV